MRGARMITQRSAGEADTTQSHPAVPDDRRPATARTLPGQPFAVKPAGLASVPGTWDKNDHGCECNAPESLPVPRPLTPQPRLRS